MHVFVTVLYGLGWANMIFAAGFGLWLMRGMEDPARFEAEVRPLLVKIQTMPMVAQLAGLQQQQMASGTFGAPPVVQAGPVNLMTGAPVPAAASAEPVSGAIRGGGALGGGMARGATAAGDNLSATQTMYEPQTQGASDVIGHSAQKAEH